MASLVLNHNSYYPVFRVNGRKKWIKIGRVDKKNAKKMIEKLELDFAKDRLNLFENTPITFHKFIENNLQYAKVNKAHSTYKRELTVIKSLTHHHGTINLNRFNIHNIDSYMYCSPFVKKGFCWSYE